MKVIQICDAKDFVGEEVEIRGWLYNRRSSGGVKFLIIRDGTGFMQAVATADNFSEDKFEAIEKIGQESSIIVQGIVREERRAPGGYELTLKDYKVLQNAQGYPIAKKSHGIDFLLSHRHLWLRSRRPFAVLRIRHEIIRAIKDFFDSRGFIQIDPPILTPSACEGTTTLFEVPYFDRKAYLSQSGQLYAEAAAMAFGKVYCFAPSFRAEKSKTKRHLTEFWHIEPEVAYATLDDIMKLAEDLITYIVERVLENRKEELKILERDTKPLENVKPPFPKITYEEALKMLKEAGLELEWGKDFGAPHETYISNKFDKPVMVHRYPAICKAFYMKRDPKDEKLALCVDVLAPEGYGEIIGGSERETDYETLLKRLKEFNLPREPYEWYLDLRRYGSCPHAGFGLGLERTVAWICKLDHVREAIPFPRLIDRIYP